MRIYLFDTDVLVFFFKKKPEAVELVTKLAKEGDIATSVLTIAELRAGWSDQETATYLPDLKLAFHIESISTKIAELSGKLRREFRLKGITLHTVDTVIAATALTKDAVLVTHNTKDYPMPHLKLYPHA